MQQDCLTRLQWHDDDFRRQRLWQISRGQNCGSRQSHAREGFSSILFGMVFQSSVSRRMAPCECNKKLATASTMVVLFAATRAPTGPAGEKPPGRAGSSLVFVFAVPNVSIAPAGTPNFRSIPRLSSLCDGALSTLSASPPPTIGLMVPPLHVAKENLVT